LSKTISLGSLATYAVAATILILIRFACHARGVSDGAFPQEKLKRHTLDCLASPSFPFKAMVHRNYGGDFNDGEAFKLNLPSQAKTEFSSLSPLLSFAY